MRTHTEEEEELKTILANHALWLTGNSKGSHANLKGADLENAYLKGADLRGANLRGANLKGADLENAYLKGADLRNADLRNADLRGADLRNADLWNANLAESGGIQYSQASWSQHGECGRMLIGVKINGEDVYFCGCFRGTLSELEEFIQGDEERYKQSRTMTMEFVSKTLNFNQ